MVLTKSIRQSIRVLAGMVLILTCEPATKAPTTGDIEGTILDATTSQPISGATVTTEPITSSKTTDSEGAYLIEGVEPETYTIQSSKTGYTSNTTTVNVVAGETASADIQLLPLEPELDVSATALNFGTSSTNLTFSITNTGIGTLTWSIISNSNWVTVNPASGTTETETDVVTVAVNRTAMAYGNHYETITVSSNANSKTIDIVMTIPNPNAPQLSIVPINLDYGTTETQMTFNLSNTGTGMLTWNITDDQSWVSVDPQSGTTEAEIDEITVTIDRLGQTPGTYNGVVSVSSDGGNQSISISFTVPDEPTLSISQGTLDFGSTETSLSFDVANAGSGELNWSVTDNQDWIITSPVSGTNYGTVNTTVSKAGLSVGDYSGMITVSSNAGTGSVSVLMEVPADQPPAAVQLYEPTNITSSAITVSWETSAETDFLSYKLYRDSDATVNESSTLVTTITNRYTVEYTDSSLPGGTTYYYKLYVEDGAHQTTASNAVSGTTLKEPGVWGSVATVAVDLKWVSALNGNLAYAVGESGKIYKWDGSSWAEEASPTTERLGGVTVIAATDIWISGEGGVWHFDGTLWRQEADYPTSECYGIDHASTDSVWVAGIGEIHFYNGSVWSTSTIGSNVVITDISMSGPTEGWAISLEGEVFHFNGFSWAQLHKFKRRYSDSRSSASAVWATNISNLWVTTRAMYPPGLNDQYKSIYHWNGSTWAEVGEGGYIDVEGITASDVWFATGSGYMGHWNGIDFLRNPNPTTTESIRKIHFLNATDGWAVGDGGVILRYH